MEKINMKIMIIGNGFDLNLGLKTSYKNFIESDDFKLLVKEDNSIAKYLIGKSKLNKWVDIEQELTNYSIQTTKDIHVKKDFDALKTSLMNYLKESQYGRIDVYSEAYKMIKDEIETTDIIYNFNYTNSILRIADDLCIQDIEQKHSYVHGSVDNLDIIFGVEDNAKVQYDHIFLKKSYNKNFGKSDIGKALKQKNDLILFGHSLGITDSSYFAFYIYSLSRSSSDVAKLKFYYYGDVGYDEMMQAIDLYTKNNLTDFKNNNEFIHIDSTNPE